jgi:hypothetical protein
VNFIVARIALLLLSAAKLAFSAHTPTPHFTESNTGMVNFSSPQSWSTLATFYMLVTAAKNVPIPAQKMRQ